ncbi:N-acetylmuramoyl-L-alanine amidase [Tomitella fengzijianii]|uniref:N-acetylmuramoyl-L-alanine amidase domain-containing protein n=1 Tax=Tomitella fengzijianii TaxID=2597660 RepID=A0A516X4I5_9ACTN|nr:N-acetylmuramoyl-L-alanine amidase [Tomitella fengzijianii]QDQ97988.1 hypothetical protein FO059_12510 [Tomitella fengzijianii]
MPTKPDYAEHVQFGPNNSPRHGARIRNWLIHTEQGNASAAALAAYCRRPASQVSYHYTVRDGEVHCPVDTDRAAWSVLDANPYTINACFAGSYAEWTRAQWLERERDIAIMAWLAVQDARKYGLATVVIAPPYQRGDGISDHRYVTDALYIGTHTDVGDGFPWDRMRHYVDVYTGAIPAETITPPPAIDVEAETAAAWIGERITTGENECPDGRGRWAQFAHGWIYWTPETGAIAVPTHLFETYAELDYEAGPLGYPTVRHTVLPVGDGTKVGDVQAFERGVLYRRFGEPGYYVHGVIGARWAREGYEEGPRGWPTSNEQPHGADGAGRIQTFEHGALVWHPTGAIEIRN